MKYAWFALAALALVAVIVIGVRATRPPHYCPTWDPVSGKSGRIRC